MKMRMLAATLSALMLLAALPGTAAASETPMGRYIEAELPMPEGMKTAHRIQAGPDGLLMLGVSAEGKILRAQRGADGAWDVRSRDWATQGDAVAENIYDLVDANGAIWMLYMQVLDREKFTFVMEVYRLRNDVCEKVELPKMPEQMHYPDSMAVSADGTVLLKEYDPGVRAYESESGAERFFADSIDGGFAVWGDMLLGVSVQNRAVEQYDLQTGALAGSMEMDSLTMEDAIATDGTSVFLANHGGIYRAALGGQVWERLVDGGLTSLRMPTNYFVDLAILDGAFYLLTVSDGNYKLLRYQYDETVTAVPTKELRVYALRPSSLLDQTIAQFQIENPDYLVSATTLLSADGGATASDVIRALNTELLAGKGPDVLLLDGMPADSYIEKGVLADLSPVVDPMLADETLLPNIFAPFRTGEAIYQAPTSFGMPVLLGRAEDLEKVQDLNDLASFVDQSPQGERPLGLRPLEDRFASLMPASFPAWFDESGALDETAFCDFLEQIQRIN